MEQRPMGMLNRSERRHQQEMRRRKQRLNIYYGVLVFLSIVLVGTMAVILRPTDTAKADEAEFEMSTTPKQEKEPESEKETEPESTTNPNMDKNKDRIVMIDAGHGAKDGGCIYNKLYEKDVALSVALNTRDELEAMGYQVKMIRDDDSIYYDVFKRAQMANSSGADIFISIHVDSEAADPDTGNALENGTVDGISLWYNPNKSEKDLKLATAIQNKVVSATGSTDLGVKEEAAFIVLKNTTMPSALAEIGFMSSPTDRAKMSSEEELKKYGQGIAEGIDAYFNPS